MVVAEIKLYELLKAKIGEKEAEAFVQILETKVDEKFEDAKSVLATKADVLSTKADLKEAIGNLRTEIGNLRTEMERGFKDQLKWIIILMFGFASMIIAVIKFL